MNKQNPKSTFLVLGGTGKTGSRIALQLKNLGFPIIIGSRTAEIPFDWQQPQTWKPALQNIDAVYVSFYPDLAMPGAVTAIAAFCKVANECGVKKLVLLSGRGEPEAQECEEIVINSGMDWTIIRASWFCQNFSEGNFADQVAAGYVALPAGNVREPFIDTDDIADIAVVALTDPKHNNEIYEVTGPRLLTFEEAIKEISSATGKTIHYEHIPMAAYREELKKHEVPGEIIGLITYLFTEVLDGRNESITDGVEGALGRKPTDFSEYIKKAIAAGIL